MITDWDDAYANGIHIPDAERFAPEWAAQAAAFRNAHPPNVLAYGDDPRMALDLFLPAGTPRGLAVFVHGGYWQAFDRDSWSHLAGGALEQGFAVALPGYVLAPQARIAEITLQIAAAIDLAAAKVGGPIYLSGHSAGGHLVSRMICENTPMNAAARVRHVLSISGVHDLRPLLKTGLNDNLKLDFTAACAESPALLMPRKAARLTCWVGAAERPEFIRQSALLANIWHGLGADTASIVAPDQHHFNVIAPLADAKSDMVRTWLA
ncbi:alpha/beta hydrolase fold domain-containing protein [Abyssibius alkaniclasticus]|uniref:alpha/beta hydrolase n=1 Tax=Abyssibius alkaniclasticus TaxID=2881234 RepID=UPI002363348D|nr:alpha/beta fold hydrolase [Abyssibius alkaniclasticus]UPH70439.1 alpha/beta hydrolase fold domain-containing protein [Abyssibius alkaniclasticus]